MIIVDSINGNKTAPMISFGTTDPNPKRHFSFGARKAALLLEAIETHGVDSLIAMLRVVAGVPVAATPEQGAATSTPERADLATVATPTVVPVKTDGPKVVSGMVSSSETQDRFTDMTRAELVIYLLECQTHTAERLAVMQTEKLRNEARDVARLKNAIQATPPVKTPKTDDTAERASLLAQIMASDVKWRFVAKNWKTEVLRAKVAALPIATATPIVPVSASKVDKVDSVAGDADRPEIVHSEMIGKMTYVLFSDGRTMQRRDFKGGYRFYKTDKVISKAPLTPVPAPTPVPVPVSHTAKVATIPFAVTVAKGENGITYVIMSDDTIRRMA